MRKEIDKAVETFHRIALGSKKNGTKVIPDSKLASFVTVLTELLLAKYQNNWFPGNPTRGSAFRCVRVNSQSIDPTVLEGLKRAKIEFSKGLFRTEVTIWVDPGVVSVRIGEEGSIGTEIVDEEVYRLGLTPKKQKVEKPDEVDEAYSSRSPSPAKTQHRSKSNSPDSSNTQMTRHSSPPMEYNPFAPPAHVSYPRRFLHATPPQSQGKKVVVPKYQSSLPATPNSTAINQGALQSGHIPSQTYTRPRALFNPQDTNGSFHQAQGQARDGLISMNYASHSMPMRLAGNMNMMPGNYLDIPAMA